MALQKHTVYIQGLERDTTSEWLAKLFKDVGNVEKSALCLTSSGTFSGKAYVTFPDETTAQQATLKHSKEGRTVQAVSETHLAEMQLPLGESQQEHCSVHFTPCHLMYRRASKHKCLELWPRRKPVPWSKKVMSLLSHHPVLHPHLHLSQHLFKSRRHMESLFRSHPKSVFSLGFPEEILVLGSGNMMSCV